MILSDDMILNTDKIIFSDLLPHVQPVRSHWQPFAFRHSLGTLAITSIFSLSSYFNFHNWFTALTWKAVHPNLIPVDLLAFTFSTPLSLSMHQFHFQYNFSTPLSHSQDHFHNTTFFSEGHFHFLNTTFTFSIPLSLSQYHFHFLCNKFHFLNVTFNISSQTHFLFLKITFTTPLSFFWRSPSLSQHNFLFLNITFTFSPHPGSCSSRPSAAWSSFPSFSSATTDLRGLKDFGRSVFDIIVDKTIMMLIAQVLFHWDGLYWFFVILFGVSGGYTASLALMYCPRWSSSSPSTSAKLCSKMEKKKDIWWKFEIFDPQVCWGGVCLHCRHDGRRCHRGTSLAIIAFVFFIVTIVIVFNKNHHRDLIVVSRLGSC